MVMNLKLRAQKQFFFRFYELTMSYSSSAYIARTVYPNGLIVNNSAPEGHWSSSEELLFEMTENFYNRIDERKDWGE